MLFRKRGCMRAHIRTYTVRDLANDARVSENTARRWLEQYQLGRKLGGRWRPDPDRCAAFLRGERAEARG